MDELNVTFTSVRDFIRTLRNTGNKGRANKKESHRIPKKEVRQEVVPLGTKKATNVHSKFRNGLC